MVFIPILYGSGGISITEVYILLISVGIVLLCIAGISWLLRKIFDYGEFGIYLGLAGFLTIFGLVLFIMATLFVMRLFGVVF